MYLTKKIIGSNEKSCLMSCPVSIHLELSNECEV